MRLADDRTPDTAETSRVEALDIEPWAAADGDVYVRLSPPPERWAPPVTG